MKARLDRAQLAGLEGPMLIKTMNQAKRVMKILFGFTLLVLGVAMIFTPGPGWLVILLGLGVLAAEFVWARQLLERLKQQGLRIRDALFVRQPAEQVVRQPADRV